MLAKPGLYTLSAAMDHTGLLPICIALVEYAPGKTVEEPARAGRFPNAQISYATDDSFGKRASTVGLQHEAHFESGQGYHHRRGI